MSNKKNVLIVGGSSGLGLELAKLFSTNSNIIVTGRRNPHQNDLEFIKFDIGLDQEELVANIDTLIEKLPKIDLLIYSAGFYQEGSISDLKADDIFLMNNVCLTSAELMVQKILQKQGKLAEFMPITSTSEWTPRLLEPLYTAVKAGLGMFAKSVSLDPKVGKVLHIGPSGMKTRFWEGLNRDTSMMLDPTWVANTIMANYEGEYEYKYIRILRQPQRVEVVEERNGETK